MTVDTLLNECKPTPELIPVFPFECSLLLLSLLSLLLQ